MSLAVVVGDVINDIVVRQHAPIATGSDTPSSIDLRPGGSGANLAAWMGVPSPRGISPPC
jgi:sugar/nucleoside kinase (ribokinase family)